MQPELRFDLGVLRPIQQDQLAEQLMCQPGSTIRLEFSGEKTVLLFTDEVSRNADPVNLPIDGGLESIPTTPMLAIMHLISEWLTIN